MAPLGTLDLWSCQAYTWDVNPTVCSSLVVSSWSSGQLARWNVEKNCLKPRKNVILIHEPEIWWNMIEINKEKLSKFINLKYVHICPFFKDQSFKKVLRIHRRLAPHSPSIQVACRKWYGHPGHHTLHIWCTYIYIYDIIPCLLCFLPPLHYRRM